MPLFKKAKYFSTVNLPKVGLYSFTEKHRADWSTFWESMSGDTDKILKWAKQAEIEEPAIWCNELYKFLFGLYSGDMNLLKQAAVGGFCKYLDTIANGHEKQPKERHWYTGLGTSHDDFVMVLRQASITEDIESAIRYVDARVVDLGHRLYEEYILSRTGIEFQINQFASNLRKRAAKIEAEHIDKPSFESDDVFYHVDDPDSIFIVQEKVDDVIVAADERGRAHYFTDPWNLVKGE